jgi:predicted dehydrogenase
MTDKRLGIGFIGGGFITRFHIQSLLGVRNADARGICDLVPETAEAACKLARDLDVGDCKTYATVTDMVAAPEIDAIWICAPNFARIDNVKEITEAVKSGKGTLKGVACEKPLARNVAEAKQIAAMIKDAGLCNGYLEDMLWVPAVERGHDIIWKRGASTTGRPYLARCSEEHSGPHSPWFWRGEMQGGGVITDLMCHSVELIRFLLTEPGAPRKSLRPVRVTGNIHNLKWSQPQFAKDLQQRMGPEVDMIKKPVEDYASAMIEYKTEDGQSVIGEVHSGWSYVGAGLRHTIEMLGPEYSFSVNQLDTGVQLFFSRNVKGAEGEDLVEKQNAEMGLMPLVPNEPSVYGYEAENRHMATAFLKGENPDLTFDDGVEVMELLMAIYMSAEEGRTVEYPPKGLDEFIPKVAKGTWQPPS